MQLHCLAPAPPALVLGGLAPTAPDPKMALSVHRAHIPVSPCPRVYEPPPLPKPQSTYSLSLDGLHTKPLLFEVMCVRSSSSWEVAVSNRVRGVLKEPNLV